MSGVLAEFFLVIPQCDWQRDGLPANRFRKTHQGGILVAPLRKRGRKSGKLYVRMHFVESMLNDLDVLAVEDLISRCRHPKAHEHYVHNECVLHFFRRAWAAKDLALCEPLFRELAERVRRRLPAFYRDGPVRQVELQACEEAYDKFIDMLFDERNAYNEQLDFFEVHFRRALTKLRLTACKKAWAEEKRRASLFSEEDEGEIATEVDAVGAYDPFDPEALKDSLCRSRLVGAIDSLDPLDKRIIEMFRQEIPIESKDPDAVTMVKVLGRSEKGIRNRRDRALGRLRRFIERGDL